MRHKLISPVLLAVLLLAGFPGVAAQLYPPAPTLVVSNGNAIASWDSTGYYLLLQSKADPFSSDSWMNLGSASTLVSAAASASVATNVTEDEITFTQEATNTQHFFRLVTPAIPVFQFEV